MKPLTMPDNGWTEEEKEIALDALNGPIPEQPVSDEPTYQQRLGRVLWGQPEVVASSGRRSPIPTHKFTSNIGDSDAE